MASAQFVDSVAANLANTLGDMAQVKIILGRHELTGPLYDDAIFIAEAYPDDNWARHMRDRFLEARASLVADSR